MKKITIKPGSIITWAEYGKLKTWWAKLRKKELPHNTFCIVIEPFELYTTEDFYYLKHDHKTRIYEPKKAYSNKEMDSLIEALLNLLCNGSGNLSFTETMCISITTKSKDFIDFVNTINLIRPNTIELDTCKDLKLLNDNKYYRLPQAKEL